VVHSPVSAKPQSTAKPAPAKPQGEPAAPIGLLLLGAAAIVSVLLLAVMLVRDGRLLAAARNIRPATSLTGSEVDVFALPKYVPPSEPADEQPEEQGADVVEDGAGATTPLQAAPSPALS
jgi:hypothetical protein